MNDQNRPILARGTIFHIIAKFINITANICIHIFLARYLGIEDYGRYGVIISFFSILQVLVYEGMVNALSKYIAKKPESSMRLESLSLRVQIIESVIIITVILLFSPFIANVLGSSLFIPYIRIVSLLVLLTALTAVYIGILGGKRLFGLQAIVMAISGITRFGLIIICIIFNGSLGAIFWGYTLSFLPGIIIGKKYAGSMKREKEDVPKGILKSVFYLTILSVLFNLFIYSGILFLQHILKDPSETGLYQASSVIARTLLLFFVTLGTTLLPSITASIHTKDITLTQRYIKQAMRYLLLISIPLTVIISIKSTAILKLVFSEAYSDGGNTLTLLVWAIEFFSIYYILNTVIIADSKYAISILIGICILTLSIVLYYLMIPRWTCVGLAAATLIAGISSVLIMCFYVLSKHRALINPLTIIRLIFISIVIIGIERVLSLPDVYIIVECAGLYGVYILLLFICKEFIKKDWNVLNNIIKPKKT